MSIADHLNSMQRVLRRDGFRAVISKALQRSSLQAESFFGWPEKDFPLLWEDVAASGNDAQPPLLDGLENSNPGKLCIGWVCLPPSSGSGGHTTMFRMVQAVEERGHECFIYLYDRDSEDIQRHVQTIRESWPGLKAEVRSARPHIGGIDMVVASSWETAYVIANRAHTSIARFYFVQDYEPFFFPRGFLWELAEDSYRLGFTTIALGEMVTHCLESFAGVSANFSVPFGCDTDVYSNSPTDSAQRSGVVFYAKRQSDRRGYWLAKRALEIFHAYHPEQEISVVGDRPIGWTIPVTVHGSVRPEELNEIYNRSLAGIALSFTNISLAAEEMMAAGVVPIVNDSRLARMDLPDEMPMWVKATPEGIASGLIDIVEMDELALGKRRQSASVRQGWGPAGKGVVEIFESAMQWHSELPNKSLPV